MRKHKVALIGFTSARCSCNHNFWLLCMSSLSLPCLICFRFCHLILSFSVSLLFCLPCSTIFLLLLFHLINLMLLFVGFSSSTHVLGQCVAWPNAGWRLNSSVKTLQRTQQTCWWHHSFCSLHPLLLLGNYQFCLLIIFPPLSFHLVHFLLSVQ